MKQMKELLMKKLKYIITIIFIFPLLWACSTTQNNEPSTEGKLNIVATTTMITDLVEVIGGNKVEVHGLMGPGLDPHGYQTSPSDVDSLMRADIVVYNGMHLEGQMGEVFGELERIDKEVFILEDVILESETLDSEDEELPMDPHIWFSVPLWVRASDYIADSLSAYDPENSEYYQANNQAYQEKLSELDTYIRERITEVPESSRFLVTAHDAFGYFGDEYGFEVIGLQGLNTQTEAGTRDVSELAQFIVENEIKAIFVESSVPTRTIESLQEAVQRRGFEVEIGGELFSDSLGDENQDAQTYLKMYKQNIDTIVDALK